MSESQSTLEELCRFCAKFTYDARPLFINYEENKGLLELINRLLPFEISASDGLPQKSCETCLTCLKLCKQFSEDCILAHEKLKNLYFLLSEDRSQPEEPTLENHLASVDVEEFSNKLLESEVSRDDLASPERSNYEDFIVSNLSSTSDKCEDVADLQSNPEQRSQPSSQSLLCDICGKIFERPSNLRVHKATHLQDSLKKKHVCSNCGKRFSSRFQLKEHENMHLGLKPYSCDLCEKKFHKRILLRQHKLTHLPESALFECCKCGLRFNRKGNLRAHEKTHNSSRSFVCRVCSLTFGDMRSLLSHRKLEHIVKKSNESNIVSMEHCCVICKKYFDSAESLTLHVKTHNQKENKQVECKICGQVLNAKALKYHETSRHSNNRPFHCTYCSDDSRVVGFMSVGLLKNHERLHTGQRPFKCDSCEKSFRSRKSLLQHKLKHSSLRNYECSFCSKRFKTKGTLKVHMKIHTGDKAYVCERCGHPFIQKSDMLKHQQRHGNCNPALLLPTEPTSAQLIPKESDFGVKTVDVAAVVLPEHVQKMLTLTNTSIFPGNLIFSDQQFVSQFPSDSTVIKSQPIEIRIDDFNEERLVDNVGTQGNPCTISDSSEDKSSALNASTIINAGSDIVISSLSHQIFGPSNVGNS